MSDVVLTKELLRDEALAILRTVRDNSGAGVSNRLADVKEGLEARVTVAFDDYFLFLRKHNYMILDREHGALAVTAEGNGLIEGTGEELLPAVEQYFGGRLGDEVASTFTDDQAPTTEVRRPPLSSSTTNPAIDMPGDPRTRVAPLQLGLAGSSQSQLPPLASPPPRSSFDTAPQPTPLAPSLVRSLTPPPFPFPAPPPPPIAPMSSAALRPFENAGPTVAPQALGTAPAAVATKGTELDLRYVKFDALGGGALGIVYRGKHSALGTEVAIKELRDIFGYFSFLQRGEVTKRLKRELCAQAQLRHPGVLQVLDQNTDVARPYYVLELSSGGNLRQKLEALGGKPLPVPQALRYFLQAAYALRFAHQSGLTHQNLKPENFLLDALGNCKLSDFGLTRVVDTDSVAKQMPHVFLGTGGMGYLPPELLAGKRDFGPEGDIYMLGLVLYELLTGALPGRRSPLPSAANGSVPVKLDPIFDRMTQDKRDARYPSVDALLDDFYQAFADGRFLKKGDLLLYANPSGGPTAAPAGEETSRPAQ